MNLAGSTATPGLQMRPPLLRLSITSRTGGSQFSRPHLTKEMYLNIVLTFSAKKLFCPFIKMIILRSKNMLSGWCETVCGEQDRRGNSGEEWQVSSELL